MACQKLECSFGSVCRVDATEAASCVCDFQCPKTVKSVCGSDGLTYDNDCQRKSAQCKLKKEIELVKNGQCVKVKDSFLLFLAFIFLPHFRIPVRTWSVPPTKSASLHLMEPQQDVPVRAPVLHRISLQPWSVVQMARIILLFAI